MVSLIMGFSQKMPSDTKITKKRMRAMPYPMLKRHSNETGKEE
jgi:hypothetical protein